MGVLYQIEAISKSNARLMGICIPQFVIGQSFDTVFEITNLKDQKTPEIRISIEVRMDEYDYYYEFELPELPARASYTTKEIKWDILNQGVCTFGFDTIDSANVEFVDKNKNRIPIGRIFHKVVSTTPEGVYEHWAMIISAIGLAIIALEKIWNVLPYFIALLS